MSESDHARAARHSREAERNLEVWQKKPLLRDVYRDFHRIIANSLTGDATGVVVEIGSGIGNLREVLPSCIRTDLFPGPWIDRVENAYALSFEEESISDLVLFDVFHHLRYPGDALKEFHRVLRPGGRLVIFDPCLSILGLTVYGLFHREPLGLGKRIEWSASEEPSAKEMDYYSAQGNATRVFLWNRFHDRLSGWRITGKKRLSAISYIASGGYSCPQLYPRKALPLLRAVNRICDVFPFLFATRLLVVLEKTALEPGRQ